MIKKSYILYTEVHMHRFYFLIFFLILTFQPNIARTEVSLVNGTYEETLLMAEQENKKIFLLFTSESCHWCDSQKRVLLENEVLNALEDHLIYYIDITENKELAKKYKVRTIPVSFIIDHKEKVYKKNIGYLSKEKFINWIE